MKTLSLRKPYVHSVLISGNSDSNRIFAPCRENATYLNIPTTLELEGLKHDIKIGASQFAELDALVEKENEPKYILITVDNLEQGYMAVTYLAAAFNHKHREDPSDFETRKLDDAESVIEKWDENPYQVPVIKEAEVMQHVGNVFDGMPFGMGNYSMLGTQPAMYNKPYWIECRKNAVCVVSQTGFGDYSTPTEIEKGLGFFKNNDKIYIICVNDNDVYEYYYEEDEEDGLEQRIRKKWNAIVLALAVDEAKVILEKEQKEKYYKLLFRSVFQEKNIKTERGFSYTKLVNLIKDMTYADKCRLVENVVNYAIKDKPLAEMYVVNNKDFDFIDRFMRIQSEEQKKNKEKNARDCMLTKLIGLEDVKAQVLDVINVMKYNKIRKEMDIDGGEYHNVHMMLGAPGTAKTTIAKLMGQIMVQEKLLPDDRFVCVNGAELKGKYVGHSAPKTKALFEENDIIVIDEAYSLVSDRGEDDSFSKEALAQLIIEIENHSTDKLVIFAGYGGKNVSEKNNKMKAFLDANPGIKSRITSTIYFDSYTAEEMTSIFYHIAKNNHYIIEPEAGEMVREHFAKRTCCENFGNGREARSLLETTVVYAAKRLFGQNKKKLTKEDMQHLTKEDVKLAIQQVEKADVIQEPARNKGVIGFA